MGHLLMPSNLSLHISASGTIYFEKRLLGRLADARRTIRRDIGTKRVFELTCTPEPWFLSKDWCPKCFKFVEGVQYKQTRIFKCPGCETPVMPQGILGLFSCLEIRQLFCHEIGMTGDDYFSRPGINWDWVEANILPKTVSDGMLDRTYFERMVFLPHSKLCVEVDHDFAASLVNPITYEALQIFNQIRASSEEASGDIFLN